MIVKTQYDIGEKVWIVQANYETGMVEVFNSCISSINIDKDNITYYLADIDGDYKDSDLQPEGVDITPIIERCMKSIREQETEIHIKVNIGGVEFE